MSVERPVPPTQSSQPTAAQTAPTQPSQHNPEQTAQTQPSQPATPQSAQTQVRAAATGQPPPGSPADLSNRLYGLQAWITDIERRMAIRTKLLLALAAIAIGMAGAAIYLAVEANRTSASQEELVELRNEVEAMQQQLGITPTADELESATEEIEEAAEEAGLAADEADAAAEDAGTADEQAESAAEAAEREAEEAGQATDDAAAIEEAIREEADGAPPLPDIGTNGN